MDGLWILASLIDLAMLVCFFILVAKVIAIDKTLKSNSRSFESLFNFYYLLGEKEKAKELLLDKISSLWSFNYCFEDNQQSKEVLRTNMLEPYLPYFDLLDIDVEKLNVDKEERQGDD